jgi:pimeloyl-ACP methyl ester carboxylesterase
MAPGRVPSDARTVAPTEPTTHLLDVPGAVLAYDVRMNATSTEPVLLLIGSPMAAGDFAALAGHFPDRTVVTYDPRGAERSRRTDGRVATTPQEHADDLHRLLAALDGAPVDVFASSGGAVNALELVARRPEQVRTLVAHEPPALAVLPDRDAAQAATVGIHETYLRSGTGPAMAKFIALATFDGPIPADFASRPAPDPATFGLPTTDDGSRDHPLLGQNMMSGSRWEPEFDALRAASTRIVLGVGAESGNTIAGRGAKAVAERLGIVPVTFPGGHDGFAAGEYHRTGQPDAFAATLRRVLSGED